MNKRFYKVLLDDSEFQFITGPQNFSLDIRVWLALDGSIADAQQNVSNLQALISSYAVQGDLKGNDTWQIFQYWNWSEFSFPLEPTFHAHNQSMGVIFFTGWKRLTRKANKSWTRDTSEVDFQRGRSGLLADCMFSPRCGRWLWNNETYFRGWSDTSGKGSSAGAEALASQRKTNHFMLMHLKPP